MRAVLIDPRTRTVGEVAVSEENGDAKLEAMQGFVGGNIEAARFDDATLFVNEEGLFVAGNPVFKFDGHPFVGPGLVCGPGAGPKGETLPATLSLAAVRARVRWTSLVAAGD